MFLGASGLGSRSLIPTAPALAIAMTSNERVIGRLDQHTQCTVVAGVKMWQESWTKDKTKKNDSYCPSLQMIEDQRHVNLMPVIAETQCRFRVWT